MSEALIAYPEDKRDSIEQLESLVQRNENLENEARKLLREWLLTEADSAYEGSTFSDVLDVLLKSPKIHKRAAIVLIRYSAVPNLIPASNSTNNIDRKIVQLCEEALPDICDYIRIDKSDQNYKKMEAILSAHARISSILNPIKAPYGDLEALLGAQRDILGILKNRILLLYCEPFKFNELRSSLEAIFGLIRRVSKLSPSLTNDFENCRRSIEDAIETIAEHPSFLNFQYFLPFLENAQSLIIEFVSLRRDAFVADIELCIGASGTLQKRYPLHEVGRTIDVSIPLRNTGPGIATDVKISITLNSSSEDHICLSNPDIDIGNVPPGDFSINLKALIIQKAECASALIEIKWGEAGSGKKKEHIFEFHIEAQASDIDWATLEYFTPYSTDVAEGQDFFGRQEKVKDCAAKILRTPMEPFYITGQKRVGKTSLIKTALEFSMEKANGNIFTKYILWGSVAHSTAQACLQALGTEIEAFIIEHLPKGFSHNVEDYRESLRVLIKLSNIAEELCPGKKFVVVIDEFDEIPSELYYQGSLAETFFTNLRALSRCKNICIILVGGENMPFVMARQGQKLNNYSLINLSYFSRTTEWEDFKLLVQEPSKDKLNWHEDAVGEVFNLSNGNPYFAKLICSWVLKAAIKKRDADVTDKEVRDAVEVEISTSLSSNSFAHLWQDGIPKPPTEREPQIQSRANTLIAMGRCLRKGAALTKEHIAEHIVSHKISIAEQPIILRDFERRNIAKEQNGLYGFTLPIFQAWLADQGTAELIATLSSEELVDAIIEEENKMQVLASEIVELKERWPTYCGRTIGTDEIRAWINQAQSFSDQRILFQLLKRIEFYSEDAIRKKMRLISSKVQRDIPVLVKRSRFDKRQDILLSYVDGPGKSGAKYASLYANENSISPACVISPNSFKQQLDKHIEQYGEVRALFFIDDIAATGSSLAEKLGNFLDENLEQLDSIIIRVFTILATVKGERRIQKILEKYPNLDIEFHYCDLVTNKLIAFPEDMSGWDDEKTFERARALCLDLGSNCYKRYPLGYGGLGLLVVFSDTIPNNSLSILHAHSKAEKNKWKPLFERKSGG